MRKHIGLAILMLSLLAFAQFLQGCAGFSMNFTGGRLDPNLYKSMSIGNFASDISDGPANLGITFTEKVKTYYQRNTPLNLVQSGAEVEMEGAIIGYRVDPVSPSGDQQTQAALLQRFTITVQVEYVDNVNEKNSFKNSFSFFQDFPSDKNLADVENELIDIIFDQIVFDIFQKTYANW